MTDLGRKYEGGGIAAEPMKEPETHYPSLYIDEIKENLNLPAKGEAVIKFKVRRKVEKVKKDGSKCYSYDIDVHAIDVKGDKKPAKQFKETEDALDEIKEQLMGDDED